MSVIIAGEKLLPMNQLISFCYGPSFLLSRSLSLSKSLLSLCKHPEMGRLGTEGGQKWR